MTILAATGLRREARIIEGPGVTAVAGGGDPARLKAALLAQAPGAEAVLSIGIGGALAPTLAPGDWVVATKVLADGTELPTDAAWSAALRQRLEGAQAGPILGSDVMLTLAREKLAARRRWGALAVDMESHVAALAARRLGLPFAAIRVISDAADQDLPPAVKVGMRPDGRMALGPVLRMAARDARQIPALIRTGRDAGAAFRALVRGRGLLGPRLGLPDFLQPPLDVG